MSIDEKVKELISKELHKPIEEITEDKRVVEDLGADSINIVQMVMTMEDEFGVSLSDEQNVNIQTVGDILNLLKK